MLLCKFVLVIFSLRKIRHDSFTSSKLRTPCSPHPGQREHFISAGKRPGQTTTLSLSFCCVFTQQSLNRPEQTGTVSCTSEVKKPRNTNSAYVNALNRQWHETAYN